MVAARLYIAELEEQLERAHDELMVRDNALYAIVDANGRGGLGIARKALALD